VPHFLVGDRASSILPRSALGSRRIVVPEQFVSFGRLQGGYARVLAEARGARKSPPIKRLDLTLVELASGSCAPQGNRRL